MQKKIWFGLVGIITVMIAILLLQSNTDVLVEEEIESINGDIVMTNKSSRPGCEKTNSCYVPHELTINVGESVTWKNDDVAFHSVTSGFYGLPTGLFDSGHLDPNQTFSINFEEKGDFGYFCTLHPWMKGTIYVK